MSRLDVLLFLILPYAALTSFVLGHIWRYRRDQFTITSRSTQLLERRWLRPGSLLFHVGMLAVLAGHVGGILVPASLTERLGVSDDLYHQTAVAAGTAAGTAMAVGFVILLVRRMAVPEVRITTTRSDWIAEGLLAVVIALGMWATVAVNLLGAGYDYRATVSPWFRSLFTLDPDTVLIAGAPMVYRLHVIAAWLLLALWPYTRLVHAWSVPVGYLTRSPILYRSRVRVTARARRERLLATRRQHQ